MEPRSERFTRPALGGVRLHALHWGDEASPALVLLHGAGANAWWWAHLAPPLARCFHVVALDFRGHGDSDAPDAFAEGAFESDLSSLLEHLGACDAPVIGHSLGAHVALAHSAATGAAGARVLVDPARGASAGRRRATRLALTLRPTYATREEALRRFTFLPEAPGADEALRRAIAERSVRREPDGRFGFKFDERALAAASGRRLELARVRAPVLVVRGKESSLLTSDGARALVGELPDARLVEVEGAGHHVAVDRPERLLEVVLEFLGAGG